VHINDNAITVLKPFKTAGIRLPDSGMRSAVRSTDLALPDVVALHLRLFPGDFLLTDEGTLALSYVNIFGHDSFERKATRLSLDPDGILLNSLDGVVEAAHQQLVRDFFMALAHRCSVKLGLDAKGKYPDSKLLNSNLKAAGKHIDNKQGVGPPAPGPNNDQPGGDNSLVDGTPRLVINCGRDIRWPGLSDSTALNDWLFSHLPGDGYALSDSLAEGLLRQDGSPSWFHYAPGADGDPENVNIIIDCMPLPQGTDMAALIARRDLSLQSRFFRQPGSPPAIWRGPRNAPAGVVQPGTRDLSKRGKIGYSAVLRALNLTASEFSARGRTAMLTALGFETHEEFVAVHGFGALEGANASDAGAAGQVGMLAALGFETLEEFSAVFGFGGELGLDPSEAGARGGAANVAARSAFGGEFGTCPKDAAATSWDADHRDKTVAAQMASANSLGKHENVDKCPDCGMLVGFVNGEPVPHYLTHKLADLSDFGIYGMSKDKKRLPACWSYNAGFKVTAAGRAAKKWLNQTSPQVDAYKRFVALVEAKLAANKASLPLRRTKLGI